MAALFLVIYVALEKLSFIHEYKGVPITPWNPGLGALFALMVFRGAGYALVLFVGVVISETLVLRTNLQWPIIFVIASVIAAVYAGATILARGILRLNAGLLELRDVIGLLGAGLSGALLATLAFSLMIGLQPDLDWADVVFALVPLLVGDTIGIAVVTPLVLRVLHKHPLPIFSRQLAFEVLIYLALIIGALFIIARMGPAEGVEFFYLLFLPVVLAALRYGLDGACVVLAVLQLGLVGVLQYFAADARIFTEFQILMLVLSTTGLVVGSVVSERERSNERAREAERLIKDKEAESARVARFSLVSGMASALAHEINQPLTAARALARSAQEILRKPDADLKRADTNLTSAIAQADHAGEIVRRMRAFLRRGNPRVSTVDIPTVLQDAVLLANSEATAKNIVLTIVRGEKLPYIFGDTVQLQQVVLNLVRNSIDAISATKREGRIEVGARQLSAPDRVEFSVWDNGPGIDETIAQRLFEPLMTSKQEGLGLGLAICTTIVESHGGKIWLHSGTPGTTEFRFTIPLESGRTS